MRSNLSTLTTFFATADRDGSGTIDRDELMYALTALRLDCTRGEVNALFVEMGAHDDGATFTTVYVYVCMHTVG